MISLNGNSKQPAEHIEELVRRVELLPDAFSRNAAIELVQAVMALHRDTLDRVMQIATAPEADATLRALASDDLVSAVLAMHSLHPDDLETRIRRMVEKLQFHFDSRGAGVALIELNEQMVRIRYTGSRPGSGPAAKKTIEEAIYQAAPEITSVLVEGAEERRESAFVPLSDLIAAETP